MSTARTAARACVLAALAVAAAASSAGANPPVLKANLQTTTVTPGYYKITNTGNIPTGAFKVKVTYEYGGSSWVDSISGLSAGQSVTRLAGVGCDAGYTVEADHLGRIAETSEQDNDVHVDQLTSCF